MADMLQRVHEQFDTSRPVNRRGRPAAHVARVNLLPTVRAEIIPRLHAALQSSLSEPRLPTAGGEEARRTALADEVPALTDELLASDEGAVHARIERLRAAGCPLETIYLALLAPTGCHLRDLWRDDRCGLADVTLALCGLQSVLRHYGDAFQAEANARGTGLRALLVSPTRKMSDVGLPTFGLVLMSEFFRREGWDTWIEQDLASPDFHATVLAEWFDLVEILATGDDQLDAISSGIRAIRRGSPNPSVGVIVCGQIFLDRPEYARLVGADRVATDPLSSLSQAESFITHSTPRKRLG